MGVWVCVDGTQHTVTLYCRQMIQKGLVTSVCNPLLPSMHYSPGPVGPLCDPLLRERRARERGGIEGGDEH